MPEIVALSEGLFESLRQALDMVARERRYLALTEAPPAEQAYDFYRRVVAQKLVMSLATEGGAVVGWCDAFQHMASPGRMSRFLALTSCLRTEPAVLAGSCSTKP